MFNILSIVFGLIALILPLFTFKGTLRSWAIFSVASFSSGLIALVLQFFEINERVLAEDFTSLMDTMDSLVYVVILFSGLTLLLNFISCLVVLRKARV